MTKINKKQKPIMVEPKVTVAQNTPLVGILMELLLFCMALVGYLYCNTTALDMNIPYAVVPIIAILSMGIMILLVWYKRVFFSVMGSLAALALIAFPVTKTIGAAIWRSLEICYNYIIYKLTLQPDFENYVDHMTIDLTEMLKNESVLNRHFYTVLILLSLISAMFFALALFRRIPILCTFILPVVGMVPFFFYGIVPHFVAFSIFLSAVIGCYSQSAVQWLSRRRRRRRGELAIGKANKKKDQKKKEKLTLVKRLDFAAKHGVFASITAMIMLVVTISSATVIYSSPVFEMQKVRDALDQFSEEAMNALFRSTYEKNLNVGGYMEDGEYLGLTVPNWRNLEVATIFTREEHPVYLRYRTMVDFDENGWSAPDDEYMEAYNSFVPGDFVEYTQFYEYLQLTAPSGNPKDAALDPKVSVDEGYIPDYIEIRPKYKISDLLGLVDGAMSRAPNSDYEDLEREGDTVLIAHDEPVDRSYIFQVASPTLTSSIYLTNFQKTQQEYIDLRDKHQEDPYLNREITYSAFVMGQYAKNTDDVNYMVRDKATEIASKYPTKLTKVQAIERYFRDNYKYSAERRELVLADGKEASAYDYLYNFLENNEAKDGYCTLLATAMVSMLRSLSIPSRVVTGYYAMPIAREANNYAVSIADQNYHAWVEVYFDGMGWVTFEPTPEFGYEPNYYLLELVDEQRAPEFDVNVEIVYDYSGKRQEDSEYIRYNNVTLPEPDEKEEEEEEEEEIIRDSAASDLNLLGLSDNVIIALRIILILLLLMLVLVLSEVWRRRTINAAKHAPPQEGVRKSYYLILRLMQLMGFKFFEGELMEEFAIRADNLEFVSQSLSALVPSLQKAIYSEAPMSAEELEAVSAYVEELNRVAFRRANPLKGFWFKLTLHVKPKHSRMIWSFK